MLNRMQSWWKSHPVARWFYPICILITAILFFAAPITGNGYLWLYLGIGVLLLFVFRPNSILHKKNLEKHAVNQVLGAVLAATITIGVCVLPMDQLPLWNGEIPGHRNQYELITESILNGRIDFNYGDEDSLAGLKNPYDPKERDEAGVWYHWDHAYYDGHYYMYFGIVPVFLAFLPYRVVTGAPLTTYHATQLFAAAAIAGIFALFWMLSKLFFKKMPFSVYLALSVAFSVMSLWYSTAEPALYCTAITCGIALEIWSIFFFVRAVWKEQTENRQILFAGIGALLGALVFGCRPPIALANVVVIPMLAVFLKQRKFTWKLLGKLVLAAMPYAVVAVALMTYNYVRFDNPFEFGQAYQLTVADQSQYRITLDADTILRIINNTARNFFEIGALERQFPYISAHGVFFNFPILLLCFGACIPSVLRQLRRAKALPLIAGFAAAVLLITALDIMWSPYLLERYRMDIYFLMGIACYIIIGFGIQTCGEGQRAKLSAGAVTLSAVTVIVAFLLCVQTVGVYYPTKLENIARMLHFI